MAFIVCSRTSSKILGRQRLGALRRQHRRKGEDPHGLDLLQQLAAQAYISCAARVVLDASYVHLHRQILEPLLTAGSHGGSSDGSDGRADHVDKCAASRSPARSSPAARAAVRSMPARRSSWSGRSATSWPARPASLLIPRSNNCISSMPPAPHGNVRNHGVGWMASAASSSLQVSARPRHLTPGTPPGLAILALRVLPARSPHT